MNLSRSRSSIPSTPKFKCKKFPRPQTKHARSRPVLNGSKTSSNWSENIEVKKKYEQKTVIDFKSEITRQSLSKKPENLLKFDIDSDISTDGGLDATRTYQTKLSGIVDKLQDQDW